MYDFDSLVHEVLRSRPDLSREKLMDQIRDKKESVGAGYLTDQGALFLIAGELGVRLDHITTTDLRLKDVYIGANDITLVTRVLAIYPINEYVRKDGSKGRYRKVAIFDEGLVSRLTLWDERVDEVERMGVGVDSAIRIVSGYVKQSLDGKPDLNLGRRGRIEIVKESEILERLPSLKMIAKDLGQVGRDQQIIAVNALVSSEPKSSDFTRSDGSVGSLVQFHVASKDRSIERRVVIWGPVNVPELKVGQHVTIVNLRTKQSSSGEEELHGDLGTSVTLVQRHSPHMLLRVISTEAEGERTTVFCVDAQRKVFLVELTGEAAKTQLRPDDVISAMPDDESKQKLVCSSPDSIHPMSPNSDLPKMDSLMVKVSELKNFLDPVAVDVIALSRGAIQDVHLKDGSVVKKGELMIGDDTGEVKLVGWRDLAEKVVGPEPGQRLRVIGTTPQLSRLGVLSLQFSHSTKMEFLHSR